MSVGKLLDELSVFPGNMFESGDFPGEVRPESYSMEPGFLSETLEYERAAKQFPAPGVKSSKSRDEFDQWDKFVNEEDFADFEDLFANMPPELARELTKAIAVGASPEEILKEMFSHSSLNRELEKLFEFLPPELLRKMKKAIALGATPEEISEGMEEMKDASLDNDSMKAGFQSGVEKREKPKAPPQQGSLF